MRQSAATVPTRQTAAPAFEVKIDGAPLPVGLALQLGRITVEEDAGLPSMFTLELSGGGSDSQTQWIDAATFAIGAAVEIRLGYDAALQNVLAGEITGMESLFTQGATPLLTVRGYDRRHRLLRGRRTRSFVQQKDSDIAATIAAEAGLSVQAQDSEVTHDYVLQANQTNMELLLERARRIQYEVVIEASTLHFRPLQNAQGEASTLTLEDELLEFRPRLSTIGQVTELQLRGWSVKDKKEIVAVAGIGDEVSTMGGSDSGAALASGAFSDAAFVLSNRPVLTQAEADQQVRARFNDAVLDLITAEGVCHGRAELRPGQVIRIDGVGERFSGQYYVTATSHRYSAHRSYHTHFVVRRNAV